MVRAAGSNFEFELHYHSSTPLFPSLLELFCLESPLNQLLLVFICVLQSKSLEEVEALSILLQFI